MGLNDAVSHFFAVIVGVGEYVHPGLPNLDATITDAQDLRALLIDPRFCRYPPAQVTALTGSSATLDTFRVSLADLAPRVDQNSTVLIYFSGHGGRPQHVPTPESYLLWRLTDPSHLDQTALSASEFGEALRHIRAGKLVVILDACYAGGATALKGAAASSAPWVEGISDEAIEGLSRGKGRVVIASSSASQPSYVREQGDTSLFTYHLLQALRGGAGVRHDGYIHILDVFHYVSEAVQLHAPLQTPILKADDLDSNFAIALDQMVRQDESPPTASEIPSSPIAAIRERIIAEPLAGAEALSTYLASISGATALRDEVDLLRTQLQTAQREIDLFQSDSARHSRSRIVYLLLTRCTWLERGNTRISEPSAPSPYIPALVDPPAVVAARSSEPGITARPDFHITISAGGNVTGTQIADKIKNISNHYSSSTAPGEEQPQQSQQSQQLGNGTAHEER